MGNPIIENFKMRRHGGKVDRASEVSPTSYSVNQERTMAQMGMVDQGINYGTEKCGINYDTPALNRKPKYDEFGTEIPDNFESSTGKDYEITASKGTLKSRVYRDGRTSGLGGDFSTNVTTRGDKITDEEGVTSQTTYKPTQTKKNFDKSVDKSTPYTTTSYQVKPYKKK